MRSLPLACFATFTFATAATAQIIPDATLPTNSSVSCNGTACTINDGTIRGVNLYHSFREFSIPTGGSAYFNNGADIANILARVTGGNLSNIDGLIRANGIANLFLINPNGIVFGANARLDIGGTFSASTASSLRFFDGSEFSATNPQAPPLLAVNLTPGLQYGASQPGATITNRSNLQAGQDLALVADKLDLQGQLIAGRDLRLQAQDMVQVRDSATTPFLAAAGGNLRVQGNQLIDILALRHPDSRLFAHGHLTLSSANPVSGDIHYWSGGNFRVEHLDGTLASLVSLYDPIIRSQGDVNFFGYFGPSLHILAGGQVSINTVIINGTDTIGNSINPITTPTLANITLTDGTALMINGNAAPTLDIRAGMNPAAIASPLGTTGGGGFFNSNLFFTFPPINNPTVTNANITIGDIVIDQPNGLVYLSTQYAPNSTLSGGTITIAGDGVFGVMGIISSGGPVILDARGDIAINTNTGISSQGFDQGGEIKLLAANNIGLASGASINSSTLDRGNAGAITFQAGNLITVEGGGQIFSGVSTNRVGNAGNVTISARSLGLSNGAFISTSTRGRGDAGDVWIQARDRVTLDGVDINGNASGIATSVNSTGVGRGGNVTIISPLLDITNSARIVAATLGQGNAGNVLLQVSDRVTLDGFDGNGTPAGIYSSVEPTAVGHGGNVTITTRDLGLINGGQIGVNTFGQGNAGNATIQASETVFIDGIIRNETPSGISGAVGFGAVGNGGTIDIRTRILTLTNGGQIGSGVFGRGTAGNSIIQARERVEIDGSFSGLFSSVQDTGVGDGGDLTVITPSLSVTNGGNISASTFGRGDAGDIVIQARDHISLDGADGNGNASSIDSNVTRNAQGDGGTVTLTTRSLSLTNGGQIGVNTFGQGNAGNAKIQASETILIDGITFTDSPSSISSSVGTTGIGQGGDIEITTRFLALSNSGQIGSGTFGQGDAGNIIIQARDRVTLDGSLTSIFSDVQPNAVGNGGQITLATQSLLLSSDAFITAGTFGQGNAGNIQIEVRTLEATGGSSITTSTSNNGQAGTIQVNAVDLLRLDGFQTGIYAATRSGSTGNGGNIIIDPDLVEITNGATIAASSLGSGIGGNINLIANRLLLNNQGSITATTTNSDGGNIFLNIRDYMLMRNHSLISATAGGIGNGGNVTINAPFILAVKGENSDIIARAFKGRGGRIDITTQGIFGLEFRERLTSFSDINASSDFGLNGTVTITTPGLDPSRGLTALPVNLADPAKQIVAGCSSQDRKAGQFIVTGKGGLPAAPEDSLSADRVQVDLGETLTSQPSAAPRVFTYTPNPDPQQIVEMQGWVKDAQGRMFLVAEVPTATPHSGNQPPVLCVAANPVANP